MKKFISLMAAFFLLASMTAQAAELVRQKNVATHVSFPIMKNDGTLITGAAGLDSEIDAFSDGAAPDGFTDCTNEATEIGSNGQYYLSLTQSEMNADYVIVQVKSSTTGAIPQTLLIRTLVGDPLNLATTDDGGAINVTSGKVDEVAALTGHTAQTGDAYAIVNNGTYGNSSLKTAIEAVPTVAEIQTEMEENGASILDTLQDRIIGTLAAGTHNAQSGDAYALAGTINTTVNAIQAKTDNLPVSPAATGDAMTLTTAYDAAKTAAQAGDQMDLIDTLNPTASGVLASFVWGYSTSENNVFGSYGLLIEDNLDATVSSVIAPSVEDIVIGMQAVASDFKADVSGLATAAALATAQADLDNPDQYKATGFSTHSAADVWAVATRSLTDKADFGISSAAITSIWNKDISGYVTAGYAGTYLVGAGSAGDPWSTALPGAYGAGTAGYIIGNNLNASISSRSSHSAADVWTSATRTLTALDEDSTTIDINGTTIGTVTNVTNGVTVTTNNDKTGYSLSQAFPTNFSSLAITAGGAVTAGTVSDKTGFSLEADQSGVTIGTTINVTNGVTITTNNDKTGYELSSSGISSIWNKDISAYSTAGYAGTYLKNAGAAGDPWSTQVPGSYTVGSAGYIIGNWGAAADPWSTALPGAYGAGTAGYILGSNLNASISSRLASASYTAPDNTSIAAILEDTGTTLPASLSTIQADLDNPSQYKATGFSTHSAADVWAVAARTVTGGTITALGTDTITAASIAANAIGASEIADNAIDAGAIAANAITSSEAPNLDAAISTRSTYAGGAVASVTGNVGGNVVGSCASVTAGVTVTTNNDKTGYSLAADQSAVTIGTVTNLTTWDKTGYVLSAAGIDAIWDEAQSGHSTAGTFGYYLDGQISAVGGSSCATSLEIADAVWDEPISGHLTSGTTGNKLNAASAAGDPWSVELPGSYAAGTAGNILSGVNDATDGDKESGVYTGIESMIRIHR